MNRSGHKILVWDAATRLFHWLTVVLVIAAYATWRINWMDCHAWTGDNWRARHALRFSSAAVRLRQLRSHAFYEV